MTEAERWNWHAEVYAFRHVALGFKDERTSPCDPEGKWYDEGLVGAAILRLVDKREAAARRCRAKQDAEMIAGGKAICERWAKTNGFASFADAGAGGFSHADIVRSFSGPQIMPGSHSDHWRRRAQEDNGISAQERR